MAPRSCAWQNPCNNPPANLTGEQDELASPQSLVERSVAGNNKVFIPLEAPIPPFVPLIKDFFIKFMKVFVESTQTRDREQTKPQKQLFKARSPKTYLGKSHMDCYHFCQQYEDYFKILSITEMNCTLFAVSFFCDIISLRWAQHKRRHQNAIPIT